MLSGCSFVRKVRCICVWICWRNPRDPKSDIFFQAESRTCALDVVTKWLYSELTSEFLWVLRLSRLKACCLILALSIRHTTIKRFLVKSIVEQAVVWDVQEACAFDQYTLPMVYLKFQQCVPCAIHSKVVRSDPRLKVGKAVHSPKGLTQSFVYYIEIFTCF